MNVEITTPFRGERPKDLIMVIDWINACGMPVEFLDAFLGDYCENKNINKAITFARREWDL